MQNMFVFSFEKLVKDFRNNESVAVALLNYYEFHILPLVNPDGYEYTHTTVDSFIIYFRFFGIFSS